MWSRIIDKIKELSDVAGQIKVSAGVSGWAGQQPIRWLRGGTYLPGGCWPRLPSHSFVIGWLAGDVTRATENPLLLADTT